jgi:hypothetical protein
VVTLLARLIARGVLIAPITTTEEGRLGDE